MSKKGLRDCPALGRAITPAECGECRLSRYACPGDCPHNPFTVENYMGLSEMEERLAVKVLQRAWDDPLAKGRIQKLVTGADIRDELSFGPRFKWQVFHQKDQDGATLIDRWERDGYAGLRNDERTLLNGQRQARFALLEALEVQDDKRTVAVDLLRPEDGRVLIVDRGLASIACRFDRFASFAYRLPHYDRMHGVSFRLPEGRGRPPVEVLNALATHLGGSLEQEWLFSNMARLDEAIMALGKERFRLRLLSTDYVVAEATYGLKENWKLTLGRLVAEGWSTDALDEAEENDGFQMALLIPAADASAANEETGEAYCGTAVLKPGKARLSASSRSALQEVRGRFEKILGKRARFESERVEDVAKQAALGAEEMDAELVPPSLLDDERVFATFSRRAPVSASVAAGTSEAFMRRYYEGLLDEPIEQLGGLTPRAAVADEAARPKLLEWVKGIVRDIDMSNLDSGGQEDANWLIRELGLDELDFPPPPPGRVPANSMSEDYEEEDDYDYDDEDDDEEWLEEDNYSEAKDVVPFAARDRGTDVVGGKADEKELKDARVEFFAELISDRLDEYQTGRDAMDAMEDSGCFLINEMHEAVSGVVSEDGFNCCVVPLLMAWLALVPKGRVAVLEPNKARREFKRLVAGIERVMLKSGTEATPSEITKRCREPELLVLLWERMTEANEVLPSKLRADGDAFFGLMLSMIVAINMLVETQEV